MALRDDFCDRFEELVQRRPGADTVEHGYGGDVERSEQ